jgi:hypothetical protein
MSLFDEIATWFVMAAGIFCFAQALVRLTIGRAKPEMTKPDSRSEAWRNLRLSLIIVALGVSLLGSGWKHDTARWGFIVFTSVIVIWNVGSRRRSRIRLKSGDPTAEPS